MSTYTLICWVRSYDPETAFAVKISKTDIVYDLQWAIKDMKPLAFRDVDADTIALYKPKNPLFKPYKENLGKFILAEHGERMGGSDELSEFFPEPPPMHEIHVIVDAPSEILCYLRGSTLNDSFQIPIRPGEGIGQLGLRITEAQPNLRSVASHLVRLYKISGSENELRESLREAGGGELLQGCPLASDFLGVPVLDPLRVVVEGPGDAQDHGRKRKRIDDYSPGFTFLKTDIAQAPPSSLAEPSKFASLTGPPYRIACNRPFEHETVPLVLYHEAFGIFKDRCKAPPTERAFAFLMELAPTACEWYPDEKSRRSAINSMFLRHWGIQFHEEKVRNTDCTIEGNPALIVTPAAIRECTNDSEYSLNQATLYYCRFLREVLFENDLHLHNVNTSFPCILLVDIGLSMAFYGAAFDGERVKLEPLARGFDLSTHSQEKNDRLAIASCFDAFAAAMENIEMHYKSIKAKAKASPTPSSINVSILKAHKFPFLTSYNDNGKETSFTYMERIHENKLIFSAVVNEPGDKECIVKFTSQYSEAAHEHLASHGMAPKIWRCIQISADWTAVVMEKSKYQALYGMDLSKAEEEKVKHKVTSIVQTLHAGDFVHGDIRDVNLLIDCASLTSEDATVHLIDFDWAGHVGEVKYPVDINCKTVKRPKGVKGGEFITQQHDNEMVSNLFRD